MSLIDEALKRARMEAAQRAAESEGLPYPSIPRHLAPRRRRAWLAPAIVILAVLGGVLAGWSLASRGDRAQPIGGSGDAPIAAAIPRSEPAAAAGEGPTSDDGGTGGAATSGPTPAAEAEPRPAAPERAPAGKPAAEEAGRAPAGGAPPAAARAEAPVIASGRERAASARPSEPTERASASTGGAPPQGGAPGAEPRPERAPGAETAAATQTVTDADSGVLLVLPGSRPEEAAAPPAGETPETYTQRYPLPAGGSVELGGIAWSETGPFALINGRVVGPGSRVGELTLERIRPGYVELAGDGRRIRISLK